LIQKDKKRKIAEKTAAKLFLLPIRLRFMKLFLSKRIRNIFDSRKTIPVKQFYSSKNDN